MRAGAAHNSVEILIAEDSPTQAEQLKYILEQQGYRLTVVRNGYEALAALQRHVPTLVISDVIMPEMDGYELCTRIKREAAFHGIRVILLTSLTDPADVIKGLEAGADSFIFKPYDEHYLLARVSYLLANQHLREDESTQMGVEVFFAGRKFFITSDRLQILNLLLSTYEAAIQKNLELATAQDALRDLNEHLESKVAQRTAALEVQIEERIQAQQALQSQFARLGLLHRITRAIGERQDLQSIFQVVVRSLEDDLPIDFGCVLLHDPATQTLEVCNVGVKSGALAPAMAVGARMSVDSHGLSRCLSGELVYEPDLSELHLAFPRQLARGGLRSAVIVPLLAENAVFGVLVTARRRARGFNSADCEFLSQLGDQVALAGHQAQLHTALKRAYDDLRTTQDKVMQQERLRALGQMASGVAHDINNALSPAALYAESLLEHEQNLSDNARNNLVTIQRAIEDVAQTVARMREFYRPGEPQLARSRLDLNTLIAHVVELTRVRWSDVPQQHGFVISVVTDLAPDLPGIKGADNEIRDALTNLIFNAVDAMPEGGTLCIRTYLPTGDREDTEVVHLEVSDTGTGMDEETKRRCLEPFFTTKGERGSGLGLAQVYGTMQRHGAEMEIDSILGRGTTVRLIFRIPTTKTPTVRLPILSMPARPLQILIVDDDPLILESLRNTLEGDGHAVVAADGGQAGIDKFTAARQQGTAIDLVITDLGMPHVDGRKVAEAIKTASAGTPVILLTGWGTHLTEQNEKPPHVDRILSKPPKLHDLRATLAEFSHPGSPSI
jgi:DNA-binding response OmpR family regulator/nitrogen-specific signal transduction histidine kinase